MKFLHIFRFEFTYQVRTVSTWLYFLVLLTSSFLLITTNFADDARDGYFLVNAPVVIGAVTVLSCVLWLLLGASVAGHAAARDIQTRMFPLTYTSPVRKTEYLGGKFLAAFVINAVIMKMHGPMMKRNLFDAFGMISSFKKNFTPSANGCNNPNGPARSGPILSWSRAATFRSPYVE